VKKILIITFYYPPCNGTPAPRPESWAKVFANRGYEVTVVTRHWSNNDNKWDDYINNTLEKEPKIVTQNNGIKIIFLPFTKYIYPSNRIFSKINALLNLSRGYLESEANTFQFKPFIEKELDTHTYDLILATAPPWNSIRLAVELSEKYKIPCVLDFRDFENDIVLNSRPTPTFARKMEFLIDSYYMRKWVKKASFLAVASYVIGDYFKERTKSDYIEIINGFDSEAINALAKPHTNENIFTVTTLGYLYPAQDLTVLFNGFKLFLQEIPNAKIHFNFIGQLAIPSVAKQIAENIPAQYFTMTNRVSFEQSLDIGNQAHVLFYIGWKNWKGVYSAKITTYLGLKKNILIAPGDNNVIDEIITTTNAGKIVNTSETFCEALIFWYQEFLTKGQISYSGDKTLIDSFSRENQAHKLLNYIEQKIFIKEPTAFKKPY
jgi:hypothetical protein